jgi:putative oxidoreductase
LQNIPGKEEAMQSASTIETVTGPARERWSDIADVVGRIAMAAIFLMSGADKLLIHTAETVQMMQAHGVPFAGLLIYPTSIFELAAGLALAAGYRARLAALLLALFTAFISPIFHAFWSAPPDQALVQMLLFTKNVAIIGGLLHVAARGTGRFALQRE